MGGHPQDLLHESVVLTKEGTVHTYTHIERRINTQRPTERRTQWEEKRQRDPSTKRK